MAFEDEAKKEMTGPTGKGMHDELREGVSRGSESSTWQGDQHLLLAHSGRRPGSIVDSDTAAITR